MQISWAMGAFTPASAFCICIIFADFNRYYSLQVRPHHLFFKICIFKQCHKFLHVSGFKKREILIFAAPLFYDHSLEFKRWPSQPLQFKLKEFFLMLKCQTLLLDPKIE